MEEEFEGSCMKTVLHKKEMEKGAEHSGTERKANSAFRTGKEYGPSCLSKLNLYKGMPSPGTAHQQVDS